MNNATRKAPKLATVTLTIGSQTFRGEGTTREQALANLQPVQKEG